MVERSRPIGDALVLALVDLLIYIRHPLWTMRTAVRQRRRPCFAVPRLFREKRIWRLVFDQNPLFRTLADKIAVKAHIAARCPDLATAPILWSGSDPAAMPANALAGGVVLKTNHGCNHNIFLPTPPADRLPIERQLRRWLTIGYGEREGVRYWRDMPRRVFAERLLVARGAAPLVDFNIFCCNGTPGFTVATVGEKTRGEQVAYFDTAGRRLRVVERQPGFVRNWLPDDFVLPHAHARAIAHAAILSRDIDFVRVDLMCVDETLYGCEMTLNPGPSTYTETPFVRRWARGWDLRRSWFARTPHAGPLERYRVALNRALDRRSEAPPVPCGRARPSRQATAGPPPPPHSRR